MFKELLNCTKEIELRNRDKFYVGYSVSEKLNEENGTEVCERKRI